MSANRRRKNAHNITAAANESNQRLYIESEEKSGVI